MSFYKKPKAAHGGAVSRGALIGDAPMPPLFGGQRGSRTQRYADRNRKAPTPAERQLARIFRESLPGVEWIPQWAFGGKWILDFYFRTAEVGVEVDGAYHNSPMQKKRDEAKARACAARGIVLVRVTNAEVAGDRALLLRKIREGFVRASQMRRAHQDNDGAPQSAQ